MQSFRLLIDCVDFLNNLKLPQVVTCDVCIFFGTYSRFEIKIDLIESVKFCLRFIFSLENIEALRFDYREPNKAILLRSVFKLVFLAFRSKKRHLQSVYRLQKSMKIETASFYSICSVNFSRVC